MQSLFGTDGIRARVGTPPLTAHTMIDLGNALGAWISQTHPHAHVVIATDTRHSAALLKNALKAGLLQYPLTITDAQILPTPALFYHTTQGDYDYGIMLTASHNQYHDNGIKIFTKKTGKLSLKDEVAITALYYQNEKPTQFEALGTETTTTTLATSYCTALANHYAPNCLQGLTLVVDCAHGAYATIAPTFLESLGAKVIALGTQPNGKNINSQCGSLHPQKLIDTVIQTGAHAGFAFDGDGDRLVAVTRDGICKDGDELIGFLTRNPFYAQTNSYVGTILSNQALQAYCTQQGKTFYRTPVGDKLVLEKMKEIGALLGGEPSGHLILRDFTNTADGLFALLQIVTTALIHNDWSFSSFTKFPQAVFTIPVTAKKDLSQSPYATLITDYEKKLTDGRLVVRYSGTEPILRIMVEAPTYNDAFSVGKKLSEHLTYALTKE